MNTITHHLLQANSTVHSLINFLPLSPLLTGGRAFGLRANTIFGPGNGFIALDEVNCEGTESTLLSCRASARGNHDCSPNEDAAALCPCKKKPIIVTFHNTNIIIS